MKLTAYTDGGKWGDRPAYIGVVISDTDTGEVLIEEGHVIGDATSNEAEYSAVAMAVYYAKQFGATELQVFSDSQLITNQLNGDWRIKQAHLSLYYDEIMNETQDLDFTITWIPREQNQRADKIGRSVLPQ